MKTHVLVTGSGGFIGIPLTSHLRMAGYAVTALSHEDGDICSINLARHHPDALVHLAGHNFVPLSWVQPQEIYRTNTLGTLHALEACRKMKIPFFMTSCYVYGKPLKLPVDETHPVFARNPYVLSKLAAEDLARFYAQHHNVSVTILRPFNTYGPGQAPNFVIPHILSQILDPVCETVEVMNLRPRRDFLYILDLVDALIRLLQANQPGIYNVGSGQSHSIAEVAQCAMDTLGIRKPLRDQHQHLADELDDVVADHGALTQVTGWHPQTPLPEGLRCMANEIREELSA